MKKHLGRLLAAAVAMATVLLLLSWVGMRLAPSEAVSRQAPRAAWLTHRWVAEPIDHADVDRLADRLELVGLTDAYVHVGPLDGDGTVPPSRAPHAEAFARAMQKRLPGLRVQAWLGQVESGGGGPLDLGRLAVRREVVRTARQFLDLGFDGIHYDIEPIWTGDEDFLALLDATAHVTRAERKVLSVAGEEVPPFPGAERVIGTFIPRYHPWTTEYHREVARHVDQIAVMTYDSAIPLAHLYRRFVARNTRLLGRTLPQDVDLLIGVPTYADWNVGHWPVERPGHALNGLRHGLAQLSHGDRARAGWAVYAEWTTSNREWRELHKLGG